MVINRIQKKEAVGYQIYQAGFMDTNNGGISVLNGIC